MFRKSRKRIVAAIMSVLTLLWVGTLCVIYVSSFFEVSELNREMLKEHAQQYMLEKPVGGIFEPMKPFPGPGPHMDTNRFKLSTFYAVAISYGGDLLEVRNHQTAVYTDGELENLARQVMARKEPSGTAESLFYYRMDKGSYTLVAFMDNTILRQSMNTLFRYTLIFGGVAIAVLFFLAVYLAKKIVEPLEESYRKQKQFVSDAGHELKTPISVVSANGELLSRQIGENPWLANIQYENERMGQLVGQLLELARAENVKPRMEELDLSRLVAGGVLPFESVAFEKGLGLDTRIPDGIRITGSSSQLSQLVSILVDNAISHGESDGKVQVSLTHTRSTAVLSVRNAGSPIPQEQLERLFERFYRADESRSGEEKHYGLGLSIAKAIVQAHSGKIEVLCRDGFVEFRVSLPKTPTCPERRKQ